VEFEGALYHVISRGNYRAPIFAGAWTKRAFVARLYEACQRSSWRLHAYVVMSNHYHLALETPFGNLCEGMHWLQTSFSTSFNRFRGENDDLREQLAARTGSGSELTEARESLWEALLDRMLERLQTSRAELRLQRKSSAEKVAIAVQLKRFTGAKNPWITAQLGMGDPDGVSLAARIHQLVTTTGGVPARD
jgi:REP element-mobilizing transposase RayT